jgi:hypothetical protein
LTPRRSRSTPSSTRPRLSRRNGPYSFSAAAHAFCHLDADGLADQQRRGGAPELPRSGQPEQVVVVLVVSSVFSLRVVSSGPACGNKASTRTRDPAQVR